MRARNLVPLSHLLEECLVHPFVHGPKVCARFFPGDHGRCLHDIGDSGAYINNIGPSPRSTHLHLFDHILTHLEEKSFTIDPLECKWAIQETKWLRYWLTSHGFKPWIRKIDAVL